uniref:Uncharacterized protein n=1 Tax=uncultured Alphaproteobacteria bacterium TaxID=91750 RepID=A0A6G8F2T4_9PROT|nr:hypothetical protein PlAlph_5170 [uncultured Alphaproteobacteria bacterium]
MVELSPFLFDNFVEGGDAPVLDLAVNRRADSAMCKEYETLLSDINARLKILLSDQSRQNLRFIKMVLAEIAPSLAEKYGDEAVKDYLSRRFPELNGHKNLDISLHPDNVEHIRALLERLAAKNAYEGRINLRSDGRLSRSECRIAWEGGEEEFSTTQILDKIREQLNGVIADDGN